MTYSVGGLIQATDYNGFANDTASANVNAIVVNTTTVNATNIITKRRSWKNN